MTNRNKKTPAKRTRRASPRRRTCFTIMPFGGWFDQYWEQIYRPAIEAAKLTPRRADDVFRPGTIMSDIWRWTRDADVLLADLTTRNGNVFYELGLAHAIGKPAVLLSESIDDVPFDLRGLRVLLYERKEPDWGARLRDAITTALRETVAAPAAAVPATFVEERDGTQEPNLPASERELLQLRKDVELIKRELAAGRAGVQRSLLDRLGIGTTASEGSYVRRTVATPASLIAFSTNEADEDFADADPDENGPDGDYDPDADDDPDDPRD